MAAIGDVELKEIYDFAVKLGRNAGNMLMDAARSRFGDGEAAGTTLEYAEKENAVDLVTQTDEGTETAPDEKETTGNMERMGETQNCTVEPPAANTSAKSRRGEVYSHLCCREVPHTQVSSRHSGRFTWPPAYTTRPPTDLSAKRRILPVPPASTLSTTTQPGS
jgi:hypothetical protein